MINVASNQVSVDVAGVCSCCVDQSHLSGTLTSSVGPITVTRGGAINDSVSGFGDLYPQATVRWNAGVNNYMTYLTGDIPVGSTMRTV